MAEKGTTSQIGEDQPTDETKATMDNMVDDILGSPPEETKKEEVTEEVEEEASGGLDEEETEEKEDTEEEAEETEEETEESEVSDEVIPASKAKKIQEKMQKRIDELTRKLGEKDELANKKSASQEDRLHALSVPQLKDLKENVDESILDLKVAQKVDGADVTEKLQEYRELKRNIDDIVKNAPARFKKRQVEALESMIEDVKDIDPQVMDKKGYLWNMANSVYTKMPSLSKTESGMAEAMAMAAEYVLSTKNVSSGQEKVKNLNQTVTKLKQKTSLAAKNKSVSGKDESFKKLKSRAVSGTLDDKTDFITSLLPDDFLDQ